MDFLGVLVVRNPPVNIGDMDPIPDLGNKIPQGEGQLSPYATTAKAHCPRACALQQETPPKLEARALQLERSPHSPNKKACAVQRRPGEPINK